jgi:hypothetical protein
MNVDRAQNAVESGRGTTHERFGYNKSPCPGTECQVFKAQHSKEGRSYLPFACKEGGICFVSVYVTSPTTMNTTLLTNYASHYIARRYPDSA